MYTLIICLLSLSSGVNCELNQTNHTSVEIIGEGCVFGAKDKDSYKVISTGYNAKILFSGGYSSDFIIEIDGSIFYERLDDVYFIKDDFCSYENDVIVIDGEVFGVSKVTKL